MPTNLRYFRTVRLRHRTSGKYLTWSQEIYTHSRTSAQNAVILISEPTEESLWIVRPPDALDFLKEPTDVVSLQAKDRKPPEGIVRFLNSKQPFHLHSHGDRPGPNGNGDHEVTCYSRKSGDGNDNWELIKTAGPSGELEIKIKHFETGFLLTGGCEFTAKSGAKLDGAYAMSDQGDASSWVVEYPETYAKFVKEPLVEMNVDGKRIAIVSLEDVVKEDAFIRSSYDFFTKYRSNQYNDPLDSFTAHVTNALSNLYDKSNQAKKVEDWRTYRDRRDALRAIYEQLFGSRRQLLYPTEAPFQFVAELSKANPREARYALAAFLNENEINFAQEKDGISGFLKQLLFSLSLSDRAASEAKALSELTGEFKQKIDAQSEASTRLVSNLQEKDSRFDEKIENFNRVVKQRSDEATSSLVSLEKRFLGKQVLEKPRKYWEDKRKTHYILVVILMLALGISLSAMAYLVSEEMFPFVQGLSTNQPAAFQSEYLEVIPWLIVLGVAIWVLRIIVKILMSQIHLMTDAQERVTMLQAYEALLHDNQLPDKHKELILGVIFRPGGSGLDGEDSGPSFVWDTLLKAILDKKN